MTKLRFTFEDPLFWSHLKPIAGRFGLMAMFILSVIPILATLIRLSGFQDQQFRVPVTGAVLYIVSSLLYRSSCPKLITTYQNGLEYQQHCIDNRDKLNYFEEFSALNGLDASAVSLWFGSKDYLYPLERGLRLSGRDAVTCYAAIAYNMSNKSRRLMKWMLALSFLTSILLMEYFTIHRVWLLLRGV